MRTRFEFRHILHLVLMAALNLTSLRIKLTPFSLWNLMENWKPLVVVCVCNVLYSRENLSLCTCSHRVLTFVTYSRCLPPDPRPLMRRRGLTWTSSRRVVFLHFCGTPKGLWVRRVSRVLGTWAHDLRPTASLGSECKDPRVSDTSYLGRVGGEGTRVEIGWHRAKGCVGSTHNFLWEACRFGS
jgi:hypothetical protein